MVALRCMVKYTKCLGIDNVFTSLKSWHLSEGLITFILYVEARDSEGSLT